MQVQPQGKERCLDRAHLLLFLAVTGISHFGVPLSKVDHCIDNCEMSRRASLISSADIVAGRWVGLPTL